MAQKKSGYLIWLITDAVLVEINSCLSGGQTKLVSSCQQQRRKILFIGWRKRDFFVLTSGRYFSSYLNCLPKFSPTNFLFPVSAVAAGELLLFHLLSPSSSLFFSVNNFLLSLPPSVFVKKKVFSFDSLSPLQIEFQLHQQTPIISVTIFLCER